MSTTCFHVDTDTGHKYGVAATGKREARQMVADRLEREGYTDSSPTTAERIGAWSAPFGTVLRYV